MNLIPSWDALPQRLAWADKVSYLAAQFNAIREVRPDDCPVEHRFEPGMYVRTMKIPADVFFIGRRHELGHEVRLLSGEAIYVTPQGKFHAKPPFSIMTTPGFHAVFYTLTDVVGETYHPNASESRDIEALELTAFEPASAMIERGRRLIDIDDYRAFLCEIGHSEEAARQVSELSDDMIPLPPCKASIGHSDLQGLGVIANAHIGCGEIIAPARIGDKRTPAGRYANHAKSPNAKCVIDRDYYWLIALREIPHGEEITVDYRQMLMINLQQEKLCLV